MPAIDESTEANSGTIGATSSPSGLRSSSARWRASSAAKRAVVSSSRARSSATARDSNTWLPGAFAAAANALSSATPSSDCAHAWFTAMDRS